MTTDPQKQAEWIAALRKKADELAANNPVVAQIRSVGKALASEARRRIADGKPLAHLGAYLKPEGEVSLIESAATAPGEAAAELLLQLKGLAQEGKIRAAGICEIVDRTTAGTRTQFMNLHLEDSTGAALRSLIPVDESLLLAPIAGVQGPAVAVSSGKTEPRIFTHQAKPIDPNTPVLKIAVMADGRITADGSPATIDSLRASLKRLAEAKGVVWYYREAGQTKAPPESAEVMKAVIENRLPIRLSSRPDYSDTIGLDGKPIQGSQIQ